MRIPDQAGLADTAKVESKRCVRAFGSGSPALLGPQPHHASWGSGTLVTMTTARSSQVPARDAVEAAWERRRRAAWIDYLRLVREADRSEYGDVEANAWELLQRRLRRNDEIREDSVAAAAPARR